MRQQVALQSGNSRITVVLKWKKKLSQGDVVTLSDSEEPERRWVVLRAYKIPFVNRGWNNNI